MGFKLTKKEVETLGGRFAEMLLFGGKDATPYNLSELANRKDWKKAESYEKKQAIADIARQAKAALLECGYDKAVVERKTEKFIRY